MSAGYEVAQYSSGTEFLTSLPANLPHCLILDLHMPQMNGFEVQSALARGGYKIRVIVLTADFTPDRVAWSTELGAAFCLPKPFDADRLLEVVEKACGSPAT